MTGAFSAFFSNTDAAGVDVGMRKRKTIAFLTLDLSTDIRGYTESAGSVTMLLAVTFSIGASAASDSGASCARSSSALGAISLWESELSLLTGLVVLVGDIDRPW